MTTQWKVGDRLRILNARYFSDSIGFKTGGVYEVVALGEWDGTILVNVENGIQCVFSYDMKYVERVPCGDTRDEFYSNRYLGGMNEDTTARNAELGEPSADCNCADLADIREELTDIKSMIGRLLQRGGDTE